MDRTALVALLLPLTVAPVGLAGPPAYAATTCHGLPVTLQGTPGANLQGTAGNDVIDTNGARETQAGAGDDTICVTNPGRFTWVYAADGNDYVDATPGHQVLAWLGAGSDTYRGSRDKDYVVAGEASGGPAEGAVDTEADDIETGAGADAVYSGWDGLPNGDRLLLGGGDDSLSLRGTSAAVDSGTGANRLIPYTDPLDSAAWGLDTRAGVVTRQGVAVWRVSGFTDFSLGGFAPAAQVTIAGSSADETFDLLRRVSAARVDVAAGGGDDQIFVNANHVGTLDGRAGRDRLAMTGIFGGAKATRGRIDLRLDRSRATVTVQAQTRRWQLISFESVSSAGFYRARAVGAKGDEAIHLGGACRVVIEGGGGDDTLVRRPALGCSHREDQSSLLRGGPGDDLLIGWLGPDVLIGEAGRDRAQGRLGIDRCAAEVESGCER